MQADRDPVYSKREEKIQILKIALFVVQDSVRTDFTLQGVGVAMLLMEDHKTSGFIGLLRHSRLS
jgi:hypothetical protein